MFEENVDAVGTEIPTHDETEAPDFVSDVANILAGDNPETQPGKLKGDQEPQDEEQEEVDFTDSEPESEEEDLSFLDEDGDEPESKESELPKGVQKRIDKLTAQKYELAEENQRLQDQLNELESRPRANNAAAPVPFKSEADLEKHESALLNYVDFAEEALVRWDLDPDAVEAELDKVVPDWRSHGADAESFLKNVRVNSNKALRQVPKQREVLRTIAQENLAAEKEFPWLKDSSNKKTQWVENQKRKFPQLEMIPGVNKYLGYAIEGMAATRRKSAGARPKVEPTAQPKTPTRASRTTNDALKAASERVAVQRNKDSLAGWIAAVKSQQSDT